MKNAIKLLFVAAMILTASGVALAAGQAGGERAAPRAVLPLTNYSFGEIYRGEIISQIFPIKNEGNADLVVTEFTSGCGCEILEVDKVIAPGKSGKARIEINTANQFGPIFKTATLRFNDPNQPEVLLALSATVLTSSDGGPVKGVALRQGKHIGPIFISPGEVSSFTTAQGRKTTSVFTITAERAQVKILRVEGDQPYLTARVETVEEGKSYKIIVEALPEGAPGNYEDQLRVFTDNKILPSLQLRLFMRVLPKQ
jgi:hypothetical protein